MWPHGAVRGRRLQDQSDQDGRALGRRGVGGGPCASMRPQHGPWRRCCCPPTLTYGPTFPFVQFKSPEAGERMRAVFRAQAVGPAREANMYRARRQTMRGAKTALGCRPRFGQRTVEARAMSMTRKFWIGLLAPFVAVTAASVPAAAQQQQQKPNILFIMGDDIGWMQPSIYHRGLMVGETPNIDRIGNEGAIFMDFLAM